jgi:hypothetical protein
MFNNMVKKSLHVFNIFFILKNLSSSRKKKNYPKNIVITIKAEIWEFVVYEAELENSSRLSTQQNRTLSNFIHASALKPYDLNWPLVFN